MFSLALYQVLIVLTVFLVVVKIAVEIRILCSSFNLDYFTEPQQYT